VAVAASIIFHHFASYLINISVWANYHETKVFGEKFQNK
jgi:hypothetical protein